MNRIKVAVAVGVLMALVAFVTRTIAPVVETRTETKTEYVMRKDTVFLTKIIYERLPAKTETLFVNVNAPIGGTDTIPFAHVDTVLAPFRDSLSVQYWFPYNSFSLQFAPGPRPIEYRDRYIEKIVTNTVESSGGISRYLEVGAGFLAGIGFKTVISR